MSDLITDREDESASAWIVQDALCAGLPTRAELNEIVADQVADYGARLGHLASRSCWQTSRE